MITPERFASTPVYDLLEAVSHGRIGFDHRMIRAIADRPAEAIPDLIRWGTQDHEDSPIDLTEEVVNLLRHMKAPDAVKVYVQLLKASPLEIPDTLVEALHEQREAALEPLLKLYNELEEDQSGEVAFILASFRTKDERILKLLLDRLEFDAGDGALCLGLYGDEAAKEALEDLLDEVGKDDDHLASDIKDAIAQLGRPVEDVDFKFNIFDEYEEEASPIFDLLSEQERLEILSSDSADFRAQAAESFVNRDLTDDSREKLFQIAQNDPSPAVRSNAWQALGGEILDHKKIRDAMLARLQDTTVDEEERLGALVGLALQAGKPPVRSFAENYYKDEKTRARAMEAMWRSFDRSFAEYFPQHLDDPNEDIKRQAIWGVGYLAITSSADKLKQFFDDDDLRSDALFAYAMSVRHEISKSRIPGLMRKIEEAAEGLTHSEVELVKLAIDERMMFNGQEPVFFNYEEDAEEAEEDALEAFPKVGRNDLCPCGSGKKFKKCHGATV